MRINSKKVWKLAQFFGNWGNLCSLEMQALHEQILILHQAGLLGGLGCKIGLRKNISVLFVSFRDTSFESQMF